jgi:hypothetical protein
MKLSFIKSDGPKIEKFWKPNKEFFPIYSEDSDEIACINENNIE